MLVSEAALKGLVFTSVPGLSLTGLTSFLSLTRSDFQFDVNVQVPKYLSLIDAPDYLRSARIITYNLNPKHQLEIRA